MILQAKFYVFYEEKKSKIFMTKCNIFMTKCNIFMTKSKIFYAYDNSFIFYSSYVYNARENI